MKKGQKIYYKDELNEEFSEVKISPRKIDEKYKYIHKNPIWNFCSFLVQQYLSIPIKIIYSKCKFHIKYIGKEKLKKYKKQGYFVYVNHTQPFADTFIPSNPKLFYSKSRKCIDENTRKLCTNVRSNSNTK